MAERHPYTARRPVTDLGGWAHPGMGVLEFRALTITRLLGRRTEQVHSFKLENRLNCKAGREN